jgi:hypothetical protein
VRAGNRAEVDHAPARVVESLHGFLSGKDHAEHVGVEVAMKILFGHRLERSEPVHARVIDQDIGPSNFALVSSNRRFTSARPRDIRLARAPPQPARRGPAKRQSPSRLSAPTGHHACGALA